MATRLQSARLFSRVARQAGRSPGATRTHTTQPKPSMSSPSGKGPGISSSAPRSRLRSSAGASFPLSRQLALAIRPSTSMVELFLSKFEEFDDT